MSRKSVFRVSLAVVALLLIALTSVACQGPAGDKGPAGEKGAAGAAGPAGEKGPAGATGPAGSAGTAGTAGVAGLAGAAGTPGASVGIISGVITDAAGKPIAEAAVVTDPATSSVKTDAKGAYTFKDIPIGVYSVVASKAGLSAAYKAKISVQAGKTATVNLTAKAEEPFPLGSVRSVGFRTADTDVYPDKKVWLTLTKGYGTSNNNIIVTSGLNNVPVGTYVYLQGRSADGHDQPITAWSWKVVGPREAKVTVENADKQQARFMANAEGKYEVIITATMKDGTKASSDFKVYANTYVGVQNCATCHSGNVKEDKVTEWRDTGHGTKFEDTFARYSKASDYCIGCHVTGYNETDKAGGFDDAAKLAGWSPEKGSFSDWMKDQQKMTIDDVKKTPMGKLINVQCEACHGPGSTHAGILASVESGSLYNPGACSQCHPQEARWRNSGHSNSGNKTMHMAEGASCVECHTAQGFVQVKIRGKQPVFPFQATADKLATLPEPGNMAPIACATCHDPHAFNEPFDKGTAAAPNIASLQLRLEGKVTMPNGVTVDAKESAVCVSCHANKRDLVYKADYLAGNKTRGAHDNSQADVLYGATASVFDFGKGNYATSPHAVIVEEGCIQCHMAASPEAPAGAVADGKTVLLDHGKNVLIGAGDHSWNMAATYQGKEIENGAICATCHKDLKEFNRKAFGDYDGNGKAEGIQTEVQGLLKLLAAELPKDKTTGAILSSITKDNTTDKQRMALWNYAVVNNDKSNGVHNAAFSVQVLQRTYQELTGKPVPGATVR